MYLQNKQENGGGAPAASPMPKLDQGIWRVNESVFLSKECRPFFGVILSSFMEEGGGPLFMGSRCFPSEMEGEGGTLFPRYDMFFPLDSQVTRIFFPNKCLTTLRVVMCVTHGWILVQAERGQPAAFLKMVSSQEKLYLGIMSHV